MSNFGALLDGLTTVRGRLLFDAVFNNRLQKQLSRRKVASRTASLLSRMLFKAWITSTGEKDDLIFVDFSLLTVQMMP